MQRLSTQIAKHTQTTRGHSAIPHPAQAGGRRSHDNLQRTTKQNASYTATYIFIYVIVSGQAIRVGRDGIGKVGRNQINRLRSSNVHVLRLAVAAIFSLCGQRA
ncbi:hypothetical protein MAPG_07586 [Magnaporthiopsis poae ATCC 64411]|uniref:Uncharacterized protein n=1 Tax=Magnaporthiopsis poae (strain ATCC 64411 / 73-15) TaxID=644358 RepID=A0A0C4E528_MAGP6|nr:hypothetical protein MAPG_07586 [Magnaporthiopsis poae ATCC 64411]